MKATAFEFRYRLLILFVILALAFWSPGLHTPSVWMLLAGWLAHQHWLGIQHASLAVGYAAAFLALLAALLRTWGAAYVGSDVVASGNIHAHVVIAVGPFRYLRNPLYLGSEMHMLALAVLMPLYGAIFTVVVTALVFYRLALAEEAMLANTPGYREYASRVPRLLPSFRPHVAESVQQPHWPQAFLGEIYCWGAAISFLVFVPQYNTLLILQGIGVSFGLYLIAKGLRPKAQARTALP